MSVENQPSKVALYILIVTVVGSVIIAGISNVDKLKAITEKELTSDSLRVTTKKVDSLKSINVPKDYGLNRERINLLYRSIDLVKEKSDEGQEIVCMYNDLVASTGDPQEKVLSRNLVNTEQNPYVYEITVLSDSCIKKFNVDFYRAVEDIDTVESIKSFQNKNLYRLDLQYTTDGIDDVRIFFKALEFMPNSERKFLYYHFSPSTLKTP